MLFPLIFPSNTFRNPITFIMPSTALQWLSLVGVIWLQSVSGTNTNFPAYSSQLKQLLSISQFHLNTLAFASDAGKLFGFFSGIAALYLPLWLVVLIGSTLGLIGYGVQYLFISDYISSLSYAHIFFLTVLAGNSICWLNTVCYVVSIRNFPSDHQVAVGLTTSYQGLSAKVYTVLVEAFFSSPTNRANAYLLLNAVLPLSVCAITATFVRDIGVESYRSLKGGFIVMFSITIPTGLYAVISSLDSVSSRLPSLENAIGILVFISVPIVVPLAERIKEMFAGDWPLNREIKVHSFTMQELQGGDVGRLENGVVKIVNDGTAETREVKKVCVKEEIGVKEMLTRLDFWLYFFVYFFGATIGLVYLNNLGQIAESRGCSATSSLVSLSASFGFFGRLMPSLTDYFSRTRLFMSRPACIAALMAPMVAAFFILLNTTNVSLYISTAIIGVCTGAITSIAVSTTTELFGTKNFSVNHNVVVANIPMGSFIFGSMAAEVYRREGNGEGGKCMGMECYRSTFIVWGSLCFLGTLLAIILHVRVRKFYSNRS